MQPVLRLWRDESGSVLSAELVLVVALAGIGMIAGLSTYRDQVVFELADMGTAIGEFNQTYSISPVVASFTVNGNTVFASFAGSVFTDQADFCQTTANAANGGPSCVEVVTSLIGGE